MVCTLNSLQFHDNCFRCIDISNSFPQMRGLLFVLMTKVFLSEHPTPEDMETYDWYKLTSSYPFLNETRQNRNKVIETDIPITLYIKLYWLQHSTTCQQKQRPDRIQGGIL
jgi:hypothetical protein